MIKIITADGKIWNETEVALSIVSAMRNGSDVLEIDLNGEGPCLDAAGIYPLLDRICDLMAWDPGKVVIHTANFLERHDRYKIRRKHQNYELQAVKKLIGEDRPNKIFDQHFRHFGHFIGHSNKHRLHLACFLFSRYQTHTVQSYHTQLGEPYHRPHLGIEDLLHQGLSDTQIDDMIALLKNGPITLDLPPCTDTINPAGFLGVTQYYPGFFVEIVNLTFWSGNTFYVDEKIWRPMAMMTPFIVQGPKDFYHNIRKLGFRTFHDFWDEGYSEDHADSHTRAIIEILNDLSHKNLAELSHMYRSMLPILEHNRKILKSLCAEDFVLVFGQPS